MKKEGKKWMLVAIALLAVVTVTLPLVGCKNDTVAEQTGDGTGSGSGNQGSGDPEQPVTYTVTFDTKGGSSIVEQTVESGQKATKPADPTLENNVFGGWYSDEDLTQEYDFTTLVTGSFTLYAKWVERIELIAYNVSSVIAGLTGDGSYILVATGEWSSDDLSAITTALNEKPTAKVNLDLSEATDLTSIGEAAFFDCDSLTSISIPSSVEFIGEAAFEGCSGLTSIDLSKATGLTTIRNYAFHGCKVLTSISIPSSVTSIGDLAFGGCSSLTSISIPEGVKRIGDSAFVGCSGLTSISIPSSVEIIGFFAFEGCSGLTSINIPERVTTIGAGAFVGCSSLNISVDGNNTTYSSEDRMLLDKEKTILIAYPSAKETVTNVPTSVTTIGEYAFYGCSELTSISIPEGVTSIGDWAFDSCSGLTSISIPSSVTSIGKYAFDGCSELTTVTMEANTPPTLEIGAFNGTANTLQILVPSGSEEAYKNATTDKGWDSYKDKIKPLEQSS